MDSKYLDSILINHDKSGFCILEFNIPSPSQSLNPKVIMSSGNSFNDIALSILRTINWKTKMKGKNRASKRYRKKQQNVIDDKMMAKMEAKKAREEGYKKRANEEGRGRPGVKAGAASDAPVKPDDAPQALSRFYK